MPQNLFKSNQCCMWWWIQVMMMLAVRRHIIQLHWTILKSVWMWAAFIGLYVIITHSLLKTHRLWTENQMFMRTLNTITDQCLHALYTHAVTSGWCVASGTAWHSCSEGDAGQWIELLPRCIKQLETSGEASWWLNSRVLKFLIILVSFELLLKQSPSTHCMDRKRTGMEVTFPGVVQLFWS